MVVEELNSENGLGHGFNDVVETMLSSTYLINDSEELLLEAIDTLTTTGELEKEEGEGIE